MAYVDKPAPRLSKVLADIIPSDPEKLKEWMQTRFPACYNRGTFNRVLVVEPTLTFKKDSDGDGHFFVVVRLPWLGAVLKFQMGLTSCCCAMSFMYNFSILTDYGATFSEEELDKILTAVFRDLNQYGMLSSRRLILNMVETGRKCADPLTVMEPIEDPTINYKPFWTYFHKRAAKVNTMLMPNANTGRIIHHMEVLFDPSFFKE